MNANEIQNIVALPDNSVRLTYAGYDQAVTDGTRFTHEYSFQTVLFGVVKTVREAVTFSGDLGVVAQQYWFGSPAEAWHYVELVSDPEVVDRWISSQVPA